MSRERQNNKSKDRKSEARKEFEEQENAGRFAGGDQDAEQARAAAEAKVKQVESAYPNPEGQRPVKPEDAPPRLDGAQENNTTAEAQNVNTRPAGPGQLSGNDRDAASGTNKATQGMREGRDK